MGLWLSKPVGDALADISVVGNTPAFCWKSGSAGTERAFLQSPGLKAGAAFGEHTLHYLLIKKNQ